MTIVKKNILDKYKNIPEIAKWKALLTEYGVDLSSQDLFNNYANINSYKIKYKILKPITDNYKVFDKSEDQSIIPSEITIKIKGQVTLVKLAYKPNSPFLVNIIKNKICLFEKENLTKLPVVLNLIKKNKYQNKRIPKSINSDQPTLNNFIEIVGLDRLTVLTFDGCWNWNTGKACKFCDFNPKRENYKNYKPSLNDLGDFNYNLDKWWNFNKDKYLKSIVYTFRYILKKENIAPHKHLLIMSGNLSDPHKVWSFSTEIINSLNKVEKIDNFDNYLNICPHPDIESLEKVKKLGINQVQYNLEVVGKECFQNICPGKCNYDDFVQKLVEAVKIMGFGKVRSNFVLGIQPVKDLLSGIRELAKKGIVADYSIFQPKRNTPLENHLAPDMDTIIYFTKELSKIYKKYNFKGIYCNLGSRSSIINEFLCAKNINQN